MMFLVGLLFLILMVGVTAFLCYHWGYQDGVKAGDWESVIARADKANARKFGDGKTLNL